MLDWEQPVDVTTAEPPVIPETAISAERGELLVLCRKLPKETVIEVLQYARDVYFRWSQKAFIPAIRSKRASKSQRIGPGL